MLEDFLTPEEKNVLENKPQGNVEHSFPQEFINRNEKIIFEGRPSLIPYVFKPVLYGIIYTIIFGIGGYVIFSLFSSSLAISWLIFIVVVCLIIPTLIYILRWSRTYYALTDRRVTYTYGLFSRKSSDIPLEKIMNVQMFQPWYERIFGFGTIIFTTAGAGQSMNLKGFSRTGAVVWRASKNPVQLKNYVQEAINIIAKANKTKEYKEMADAMKEAMKK
ncbi:MAG: PH domain-containing protein [Nitrososphaeria archaeon]